MDIDILLVMIRYYRDRRYDTESIETLICFRILSLIRFI